MAVQINDAEEAARYVVGSNSAIYEDVEKWLANATAREIQIFIHRIGHHQLWLRRAETVLQVRLSEDSAKIANQMVDQTSKLLEITNKLSAQTNVLVSESKRLGRLTWALIFLTVGLLVLTAGLLYIDWHREHEPPAISHQG